MNFPTVNFNVFDATSRSDWIETVRLVAIPHFFLPCNNFTEKQVLHNQTDSVVVIDKK